VGWTAGGSGVEEVITRKPGASVKVGLPGWEWPWRSDQAIQHFHPRQTISIISYFLRSTTCIFSVLFDVVLYQFRLGCPLLDNICLQYNHLFGVKRLGLGKIITSLVRHQSFPSPLFSVVAIVMSMPKCPQSHLWLLPTSITTETRREP
jgi:hypothetical protein